MNQRAVVIGDTAGARRAAAGLRARGWDVTLVESRDATPEPVVPARGAAPLASTVLGAMAPVSAPRSVWVAGQVRAFPLSSLELARVMPAGVLAGAARAWGRARGTQELKKLVGGGNETRTYRDWVVHSFGAPIHEVLFAPYARKRWGDPATLSCNVARLHHGWDAAPRVVVAGDGEPDLAGVGRVRASVRAVHGRAGAEPAAVEAVAEGGADVRFEGTVFADLAPAVLIACLRAPAAVADGLRADALALPARDLIEVGVPFDGPVGETHVVDADVPFFRVDAAGDGRVRLFAAVDADADHEDGPWVARAVAALGRMGHAVSPRGVTVRRMRAGQPVWTGPHLSRLRRHVLAAAELGVVPVGRAGVHAMFDPVTELAWVDAAQAALAEEKPLRALREAMRTFVEPPPEEPAERARLAEFVRG